MNRKISWRQCFVNNEYHYRIITFLSANRTKTVKTVWLRAICEFLMQVFNFTPNYLFSSKKRNRLILQSLRRNDDEYHEQLPDWNHSIYFDLWLATMLEFASNLWLRKYSFTLLTKLAIETRQNFQCYDAVFT